MTAYAIKRLLSAVPTLLLLVVVTFFLVRAAPGGPFDEERALPPEVRAQVEAAYRLDETAWQQLGHYLAGLLRGDLGPSYQYPGLGVNDVIAQGFPASLVLGGWALVLSLLAGGAAGVAAAQRPNSLFDRAVMSLAMTGVAVPAFVVAPLAILLFAVTLGWLPAGGWQGASTMVLPILTLALPQIAYVARLLRASMIDVLSQDYIRTARAKGLPARTVILRHALRPAFLPVLSYLGPATAQLITGSVVVEQIFGIPGLGRHFVQGALNRDYTVVMGVVVFYGALIILLNLLVDLLYGVLDPRARAR